MEKMNKNKKTTATLLLPTLQVMQTREVVKINTLEVDHCQ